MFFFKKKPSSNKPQFSVELYCVGHKPPVFDVSPDFCLVSPDANAAGLHIADDAMGERFDGKILSEYTQLFGLADHLAGRADLPQRLFFFQYRKFLSPRPGATRSTNMPYVYAAPPKEAASLFPGVNVMTAASRDFVRGPAFNVGVSMARGYALSHVREDFDGFAMALREVDGFTEQRCERFINSSILIPAPSLCMVPTDFFLQTTAVLRQAWDIFSTHHYKPREGYQRRVGGFLLERLHSYLMQEYLMDNPLDDKQWEQIIVSDTAQINPTI